MISVKKRVRELESKMPKPREPNDTEERFIRFEGENLEGKSVEELEMELERVKALPLENFRYPGHPEYDAVIKGEIVRRIECSIQERKSREVKNK